MVKARVALAAAGSLVILGFAATAHAKDPAPSQVCIRGLDGHYIVDKEKLARFWMAKHPLSLDAVPVALLAHADPTRLHAAILGAGRICDDNKACGAGDKTTIATVRGIAAVFFAHKDGPFTRPTDVEPQVYFNGPNEQNEIVCAEGVQEASAPEAPTAKEGSGVAATLDAVRVRANADQLGVARDAGAAFQGTGAAQLSYLRDSVAKTNTYKVSGVVGVTVADTDRGSGHGWQLVPYVGLNRTSVTNFTGASKPASNDTVDLGVYLTDKVRPGGIVFVPAAFSVRPDYLWNRVDDSQLFTLNATATPIVNGRVNDYDLVDLAPLAFEPTLVFKLDVGRFTHVGSNALAAIEPTYARAGAQVGINVISQNTAVPLTFTASYLALHDFSGGPYIGHLNTSLTWNLDPKKYVGISVSYVNGRREDTAKREQQANLSLNVKY